MLDYETLKEIVIKNLVHYLPENLRNVEIKIEEVKKANITKEEISCIPDNENYGFGIPVSDIYEYYRSCGSLFETLSFVAYTYASAYENIKNKDINVSQMLDTDNIFLALAPTEGNAEFFANIPHREFNDLSIYYRLSVPSGPAGKASAAIDYSFMERLNLTEEKLYDIAYTNTPKVLEPMCAEILPVILSEGDLSEQDNLLFNHDSISKDSLLVLTGKENCYRAGLMLYPEIIASISDKVGESLYVIPSSVHELLLISDNLLSIDDISEMVKEVNKEIVQPEERLSNNIYYFDKNEKTLSMKTRNSNKNLHEAVKTPPPAQVRRPAR